MFAAIRLLALRLASVRLGFDWRQRWSFGEAPLARGVYPYVRTTLLAGRNSTCVVALWVVCAGASALAAQEQEGSLAFLQAGYAATRGCFLNARLAVRQTSFLGTQLTPAALTEVLDRCQSTEPEEYAGSVCGALRQAGKRTYTTDMDVVWDRNRVMNRGTTWGILQEPGAETAWVGLRSASVVAQKAFALVTLDSLFILGPDRLFPHVEPPNTVRAEPGVLDGERIAHIRFSRGDGTVYREMWIDPERGCVLRRLIMHAVDNGDWVYRYCQSACVGRVAESVWLPRVVVDARFERDGGTAHVDVWRVLGEPVLNATSMDGQFDLRLPNGTQVHDLRFSPPLITTVGKDPRAIGPIDVTPLDLSVPKPSPPGDQSVAPACLPPGDGGANAPSVPAAAREAVAASKEEPAPTAVAHPAVAGQAGDGSALRRHIMLAIACVALALLCLCVWYRTSKSSRTGR